MVKATVKILVCLLVFCIEITVSAEIIKSPEECSGEEQACVVKNISNKTQSYDFENISLRVGSRSIFRIDHGEVKLLKGEFLVECLATCLMSALHIEAIQVNSGSFYLNADLKSNSILGLTGDVVHQIKGKGRFVLMSAMLQRVEKGDLLGPKTELPMVVSKEYLKKTLWSLSRQPKILVDNLERLKKTSIEEMSKLSKELVVRKIASYKENEKKSKARRKQYDDESHRLRMLFRSKNLPQ